ncbi:hydroxyethylthiazole kinase [Gallibacterium salpingitidis]|uniref:Hydroxyethylthiazole kinase n=1 Tax=Gallibacterium salpingitidis TaxID=505341 RepID=A0AB36E1E3_9PAST|nr:hydroxyethylthiazole kinase [Gallibacterium salpingitidis]OBX09374.1 hydroxyethylthiazole kinase [Gallibacterium salpingitidis]
MQFNMIEKIRQTNPLIHNITNIVVANYVANGLLALGASPIMADAEQEVAELATFTSALILNIGTLDAVKVKSMLLAGKAANQQGVPVILDPVGVGATSYRKQAVAELLQQVKFTAIRGNAGEIAQLAGVAWSAKGVDAGEGGADIAQIAQQAAQRYQCVVAVSGEIDYISDGKQLAKIANGTPMFPKITGSGCLLGAVIGAFLALDQQNPIIAVTQACTAYAVAGEIAAQHLQATQYGQFYTGLLDSLAALTDQQVQQLAKVTLLGGSDE